MNTKSIIEIFRGDDSDALGYQTIVGTIHTDLDLAGCKAVFRYLGFFQEFDPIPEDGKLTIVIPAASSIQFPPGLGYASLKVYDIDRKVRTFTNRIPVFVSTKTPCRCGGEFDVEFSPFPELEPLKIFIGPNADDYDLYTGFVMKIIDRASAEKYGLSMIYDDMDSDMGANSGVAASPVAVKAAYDAILGMLADNYYNKEQTDEQIDKLAAYYITSDAQGNPFATHAALVNATTYYSGGSVRVPTRNDYAIVIADETHNNEEWRYIYAKNDQGVGQWEPQYAVEGVIAFDDYVTKASANGVKSSGIWSALWGALTALPTGFTSLYDWCVAQLAGKVPTSRKVNGNALSSDVTLTGADIAVSGTDATKIDAALAGKLDKSGGTVTGDLEVDYAAKGFTVKDASGNYLQIRHAAAVGDFWYVDYSVNNVGSGSIRLPYNSIIPANVYSLAGLFDDSTTYTYNSLCVDIDGRLYRCVNPNGHTGAWVGADFDEATIEDVLAALRTAIADKANTSDLLAKLDSTSAAPAFSSDSTVQYAVGSHVTYNGKLYVCTTATTGGIWDASKWTADTMTDPDAVLDITAQNQLRVVAKDGTLLWAQGYDLASTSSATLACDAVNNFTFADGATTQAFTLPTAPTGKVGDFGLDIDNSANTGAATMTLTGLDSTFSVVVPEGESLNDMLAIAAGELARFYITLSTFRVNNLPTWHIVKQVVENGGATV